MTDPTPQQNQSTSGVTPPPPVPVAPPAPPATQPVAPATAAPATPAPVAPIQAPTQIQTPALAAAGTPPPAQGASAPLALNHPNAKNFDIPRYVSKNFPDVIDLVLDTKSMDDKERQYWFHILPIMNEQQVNKLRTILTNEKQKLADIDKKYANKMDEEQSKKISYWEGQKLQERFSKIKQEEKAYETLEQQQEAQLLNKLSNL